MADIVIFVTTVDCSSSGDNVAYSGIARCTGMSDQDAHIQWQADLDPGVAAAAINAAIRDAAIAAADDRNYTVGLLDSKIILGAAIGL